MSSTQSASGWRTPKKLSHHYLDYSANCVFELDGIAEQLRN